MCILKDVLVPHEVSPKYPGVEMLKLILSVVWRQLVQILPTATSFEIIKNKSTSQNIDTKHTIRLSALLAI